MHITTERKILVFRFFIKSGNIGDHFAITQLSGEPKKALLWVTYPLDRELQEIYTMQLVVIDDGGISGLYLYLIQYISLHLLSSLCSIVRIAAREAFLVSLQFDQSYYPFITLLS